jgi:hypothetical protein
MAFCKVAFVKKVNMFFQHFIRVGEPLKNVAMSVFFLYSACPCIPRMSTNIFEKMCSSWPKWIWSMFQNSFEESVGDEHEVHREGLWISFYKACVSTHSMKLMGMWGWNMEGTGKDPGYPSMKYVSALPPRNCCGCNKEDTGKDPGYPSMKHASHSFHEIVGE